MESQFQHIFRTAASYMTLTSLSEGTVIEVSDSFLEVLGHRREDVVGKRVPDLDVWVDPSQRETIVGLLKVGKPVRGMHVKIRTSRGDVRACILFAHRVGFDGAECMLAEAIDITDLEEARAKLSESESRFVNLLEHVPLGIQGYGADGTIFYWNRRSEEIYGYAAKEALGRNLGDLIIPPDLKPQFAQGLALASALKESGEFLPAGEVSLKRKDGSRVEVHSIHTAVLREGKPPMLFCIDMDLSERRRADEALKAKMAEAEKLNRFMMGRETRVIELKREINDLLKEFGKPARYNV